MDKYTDINMGSILILCEHQYSGWVGKGKATRILMLTQCIDIVWASILFEVEWTNILILCEHQYSGWVGKGKAVCSAVNPLVRLYLTLLSLF